jgi:hypothetical protein
MYADYYHNLEALVDQRHQEGALHQAHQRHLPKRARERRVTAFPTKPSSSGFWLGRRAEAGAWGAALAIAHRPPKKGATRSERSAFEIETRLPRVSLVRDGPAALLNSGVDAL